MSFRRSIIVFTVLFLIGACSRDKDRQKPVPETTPEIQLERRDKDKAPPKEEKGSEIGTIEEFTPEVFVRLTILYRKESSKWLEDAAQLSEAEQQRYFDEENRRFFEKYGITEEDYIRYSTDNIEELNRYMEENPDLMGELRGK